MKGIEIDYHASTKTRGMRDLYKMIWWRDLKEQKNIQSHPILPALQNWSCDYNILQSLQLRSSYPSPSSPESSQTSWSPSSRYCISISICNGRLVIISITTLRNRCEWQDERHENRLSCLYKNQGHEGPLQNDMMKGSKRAEKRANLILSCPHYKIEVVTTIYYNHCSCAPPTHHHHHPNLSKPLEAQVAGTASAFPFAMGAWSSFPSPPLETDVSGKMKGMEIDYHVSTKTRGMRDLYKMIWWRDLKEQKKEPISSYPARTTKLKLWLQYTTIIAAALLLPITIITRIFPNLLKPK